MIIIDLLLNLWFTWCCWNQWFVWLWVWNHHDFGPKMFWQRCWVDRRMAGYSDKDW